MILEYANEEGGVSYSFIRGFYSWIADRVRPSTNGSRIHEWRGRATAIRVFVVFIRGWLFVGIIHKVHSTQLL